MSMFTKQFCAALIGIATLASCSRPVAYFQRGPVENYHSPKTETVATTTPVEAVAIPAEAVQPTVATTPAVSPTPETVAAAPAPAEQVAQANAVMSQLDTYVRNDSKLSADKKLNKRMDRVKHLLATETAKATTTPTTASSQKMNLLERMATKRLDKQIKHKLGPEQTKRAMAKSLLTIGLIVGIIGLILILIGSGFGATLGVIALIVGLALILVDLLR